jgi:hypothetical protein
MQNRKPGRKPGFFFVRPVREGGGASASDRTDSARLRE